MTPEELKKMTKAELLELAREKKFQVSSQMSKAELVDVIAAAAKKKKEPAAVKPLSKMEQIRKSVEKVKVLAAKRAAKQMISGTRKKSRIKAKAKPEAEKRPASERSFLVRPVPAPPVQKAQPMAAMPPKPVQPLAAAPPKPVLPAPPAPPKDEPRAAKKRGADKSPRKKRAPHKPTAKRPAEESKRVSDEAIRQMAEEGKYYLGAEQRVMPPVEAIEVPGGYNVDRIVAMVRDPHWIFTYWEVTDHKYRELERHFGNDWPRCKMVLRVYDKTDKKPTHLDIELSQGARNWYINVGSERRYQVAIGALSPDGRFEQVAISNVVETPSGRISDRVDEEWMVPDDVFARIFTASGGYDMHAASAELKELISRRLEEEISSGAVSSFGSGALRAPEKGRRFRLWVATELILYGGTEPDARVTVQGKEVKLRADGTFSLRFALPDGKIGLPVTAVSADAVEERTIDTNVTKKSEKKAPVLK